jgi:hypothetical protein
MCLCSEFRGSIIIFFSLIKLLLTQHFRLHSYDQASKLPSFRSGQFWHRDRFTGLAFFVVHTMK